jgi:hypothetical protein
MSSLGKISRDAQYWVLVLGLVSLSISIIPAIEYLETGTAIITMRGNTYIGPVAEFVITSFLVSGLVLVFTSIRNIHKSYSAPN